MDEPLNWSTSWRVDKYDRHGLYDTIEGTGNLLVNGGASAMFERLIGSGVNPFDNTYAHLGVGNSSTASTAGMTDLQGASKFRQPMDATYPIHVDGFVTGSRSIVYVSTFANADANFAWNEWGLFNDLTADRMLNRKVVTMGTKTSADEWVLTITLSMPV